MDDIPQDQLELFKEAFSMYDKNSDNKISIEELGTVVRSLGQNPTEAELKNIISDVDDNGNGTIEFNEFCKFMANLSKEKEKGIDLKEAFKVFDEDKDGLISSAELRKVLTNLGEKLTEDEVNEMMQEADIDGNGYIDYEEFAKMIQSI